MWTSAAWSPAGDRLVIGNVDGFVRVWDAASGELIWHKLLAPVIRKDGRRAYPYFVGFSRDGKLVVAVGPRDDPPSNDRGVVAIYDTMSGRTVREVALNQVRQAAIQPDGRMLVVAQDQGNNAHLIGVEVETGRIRWVAPPIEQSGFKSLHRIQFEGDSPWFDAILNGGNMIRLNGLTGHEQRRFLADARTPEQKKAAPPGRAYVSDATLSEDGRILVTSQMESIHVWDVNSGAAAEYSASPSACLQAHARGRLPHVGDLGFPS